MTMPTTTENLEILAVQIVSALEPPEVDDWRPGDHRPKAKEE